MWRERWKGREEERGERGEREEDQVLKLVEVLCLVFTFCFFSLNIEKQPLV